VDIHLHQIDVVSYIDVQDGSFLPGLWLVGTTKVYPGVGADIVMESITLIDRAMTLAGTKIDCVQNLRSGSFQKAANPDQNYRANKRYNDGAYYAATWPDSQSPEEPAAQNAAEDSENDVHDYAIATALHDLASEPPCDQSNDNPSDEPHVYSSWPKLDQSFPSAFRPTENVRSAIR
jgi:hypothetical protein